MGFLDIRIFTIILILRLSSVYFVRSSFVPDEYWQSLEVSHRLTYGYGHYTWEWDKKIRSYFYPFIIHLLYKVIPDSPLFIIHSPRVLQAVLSTVGDYFAYKLAVKLFGQSCGMWALFNILTSWFLFYCSPRTLTNMAEASLTSCGLYFYPWNDHRKSNRRRVRFSSKYMWFAAISTVIRPTAIVTWLPLYLYHALRDKRLFSLIRNTFVIGFIVLSAMLVIDKWCYGDWVFTPYNFFLFNWRNDIGAFYGSHHILWNFLIGLPTVLGFHILPFVCGLYLLKLYQFSRLILWVMIIFSIPSHKEFRFLLPILHLCFINCGVLMNDLWCERLRICGIKIRRQVIIIFVPFIVLFNASLSLYMGLYHQRGVIDAVLHLSETVNNNSNVLFLMPCHSTPYYSYIHKDIKMRFLTCEPNFERDPSYIDEADDFFNDPPKWLSENYKSRKSSLPSHIVLFDTVYNNISMFLRRHQYHECFTAFHSHFAQGRTGNFVYIYCK